MPPTKSLPKTIKPGALVSNMVGQNKYKLGRQLGRGGFGTAFEAVRTSTDGKQETVCLKITSDADSWHGEAYLGRFLRNSSRAVQTLDVFPFESVTGQKRKTRRTLFAIASELMVSGTVGDWCEMSNPWPESRVRLQIRMLLETLDHLHYNGITHRDITPYNAFVAPRSALKLGDFGIASMAKLSRVAPVDAYNPAFKPPNVQSRWDPRDDIYQVGLLAMTMLSATVVTTGPGKVAVNALATDRQLRDVIKTAIDSKPSERWPHADAMANALK